MTTVEDVLQGRARWLNIAGHALHELQQIPDGSISVCVLSPPYFNLRDYGLPRSIWGGDPHCQHDWRENIAKFTGSSTCRKQMCDAWWGCLGLEDNPEQYILHLAQLFSEVWRVLHKTGTLWVNIGDSSAGSGRGPTGHNGIGNQHRAQGFVDPGARTWKNLGIKAKDLILIPERFALMMQEMGWYVRSRIAWCKKASKPESVQDRPTSGWEHVWMFSKSRSYFYDVAATKTGDSQMRNYWVLGPNTGEPWEYCNGCGTLYTGHSRAKIARVDGQRVCAECGDDGGWTGHYATYPLALPERCILAGSSEGGVCVQCYTPLRRDKLTSNWFNACKCPEWRTTPATVLDVCMGSGTTMLAALKHRRGVIGIDMSQDYVNIADGRATSAGYEQTVRRSRQWQAQAI